MAAVPIGIGALAGRPPFADADDVHRWGGGASRRAGWAAAIAVPVGLIAAACASPLASALPSTSSPRSASVATASTVPTPAGVLGLAVGASQVLSCDADFPSFSPDGRWLACGTQLESWPDLTTVAALSGSPLGWSARDQLLVLVSNNQYRLITPQGAAVDLKLNPGDMPEWSSDGQRLLLHSDPRIGDRLRLGVWIADGTIQPLVDLPAAGADRIDLSGDGNTVLRSSMICGSPGCQFAVTASRPDGSGAVSYGPVPGNAVPHLAADGSYWFALGAGTNLSMWAAPPAARRDSSAKCAVRGRWPTVGSRPPTRRVCGAGVLARSHSNRWRCQTASTLALSSP